MQSLPPAAPAWVRRCVSSVATWAADAGFLHEVLGDELLDLAPAWVRDAAGADVLPVTDVARLLLVRDRLAAGATRVVWLDADVVVFAPAAVDVDVDAPLAVGHEVWVTGGAAGSLRAVTLVCNAVVVATDLAAVDDLLAETLLAARTRPLRTRSLGPDLLTVLDRRRAFPRVPGVGLCSPMVVDALAAGGGPAWDLQRVTEPWPLGAVNLCASLATEPAVVDRALDHLLSEA